MFVPFHGYILQAVSVELNLKNVAWESFQTIHPLKRSSDLSASNKDIIPLLRKVSHLSNACLIDLMMYNDLQVYGFSASDPSQECQMLTATKL